MSLSYSRLSGPMDEALERTMTSQKGKGGTYSFDRLDKEATFVLPAAVDSHDSAAIESAVKGVDCPHPPLINSSYPPPVAYC